MADPQHVGTIGIMAGIPEVPTAFLLSFRQMEAHCQQHMFPPGVGVKLVVPGSTDHPREARSVGGRELRALPDTLTVEEVAELLRSQAVTRLTSGRKLGDPEPLPESGLIYCVGILADPQEEEAGA